MAIFAQWTRAEPGLRRKNLAGLQADHERRLAGRQAASKAEVAWRDQEHAVRAAFCDPGRARARLALLEQQAVLATDTEESDAIGAGERYPMRRETASVGWRNWTRRSVTPAPP